MSSNKILVYAGDGSSHSWTWLADLFESSGITEAEFLDAYDFLDSMAGDPSTVVISGGDGFAIANAFWASGFSRIRDYLMRGGQYVGICAGAYLPLPSSIEPLNAFNISTTKIENLVPNELPSQSPRVAVSYGTCSVIHPVRGELNLKSAKGSVIAPLYGGPIFREPTGEDVIMRYSGFTPGTEFQVDTAEAEKMVLGRPAAITLRYGPGRLLLLGPHLEHPAYPEANRLFLDLFRIQGITVTRGDADTESRDGDLLSAIANLKVAILGLENRSFLVGNKLWDGSRYMDLLNAIERRSDIGDRAISSRVVILLNKMRSHLLETPAETAAYEDSGPALLVEAARLCVNHRFELLRIQRKQMGL